MVHKNKEYVHATVWKMPDERQQYTKLDFRNLEQLIKIREEGSHYARFEINRNTLEGNLHSEFDLGVCDSGLLDSSYLNWKSGEIIEEEEYRQLFNKIKLKDDEITQNFEERKKETKKF